MSSLLSVLRLIHNENIKIVFQLKTLIMAILIVVITFGLGLFTYTEKDISWKKSAEEQVQRLEKSREEAVKKMSEEPQNDSTKKINELILSMYDDNLKVLRYCIDKNIPYKVMTPLKFTYEAASIIGLILLFMIVQASNTVANEYSMGTIKQLLMKPYRRWKILLSKYLSIVLISTGFLILLFSISYIVGAMKFSGNGSGIVEVILNDGMIVERNVVEYTIQAYLFGLVEILMLTALSLMLAVIFKNVTISIIASIGLWMGGAIATNFLGKYSWYKFLIFPHLDLKQYLPGETPSISDGTIAFSIVMLVVYFIIFISISLAVFTKRDVY